jgi:hypothetical protein
LKDTKIVIISAAKTKTGLLINFELGDASFDFFFVNFNYLIRVEIGRFFFFFKFG